MEHPIRHADQSVAASEATTRLDRRQFLTTAAGLLVPAAAAFASPDVAEAGRARRRPKRHKRHKRRHHGSHSPLGWGFADDTLVNLINHTHAEWDVSAITNRYNEWFETKLAPGRESGWNPGVPGRYFSDETHASIR